ncbi:MAG: glycosyltransferase family 39 protein [Anaerolineales bacterium]|nr:glycosyltransferase family 39 protein [Anaerolineales bacterium]
MTRRQTALLLTILFSAAALLRLYDLTDEPLEVHPTRQMRAALVARALYYPTAPQIPPERVEFAAQQLQLVGVIEPPIQEFLTAQLYRLAGSESPWLGRIISITFWLLGGWAVYALALQLGSSLGGFAALIYYLFLPFSVRFSRTLLPDPIMVASSVTALWALYTWQKKRTLSWAIFTGLITGFAILTKSVAGIILILPFAAYILSINSFKQTIKNWQVWLILILAALPSAIYYFWGLVLDGRLAAQFSGRFFPDMWTDMLLYKSWGLRIITEFGLPAFLLGIAGIFSAREKAEQRFLFFWWTGYFIYGMLFAYHIMTHDYYHLSMVPLTAVSLAVTIAWLEQFSRKKNWLKPALAFAVATMLVFTGVTIVQSIKFADQADFRQTRDAYYHLADVLEELPPAGIIALTEDYETSLRFYTFRNASHWPHLGDLNYYQLAGSERKEIESFWEKTEGAGYFLISDWNELSRQPTLEARLSTLPVLFQDQFFALYLLAPELTQ